MSKPPTAREIARIEAIVKHFGTKRDLIDTFLNSILVNLKTPQIPGFIHSIKSRIKDPQHLRDKLIRKLAKCKKEGVEFDYSPDNLLTKVTDLAGIRILHLHTRQIVEIDKFIKDIVEEQSFNLVEPPSARTWDDEYRTLFKDVGIETQNSPTLYTSVHYVVGSQSRTPVTCEIQVRTLMEEVWGEVDHTLNYPHEIQSVACREQIRALARVTSGSTRLVDAIFATVNDINTGLANKKKK